MLTQFDNTSTDHKEYDVVINPFALNVYKNYQDEDNDKNNTSYVEIIVKMNC